MNIAVIFAGGVGSRMKTKTMPKQFLKLNSKPIIVYTLEHFQNNKNIDHIVISCLEDKISYMKELVKEYNLTKVSDVVVGGSTGQESIYNGLLAAQTISKSDDDVVLIHDGVRPLINSKLIDDCINSVNKYGSAITTSPVNETLVIIDKNDSNLISEIPTRDLSRIAKAPQCFRIKDILDCHNMAKSDGINNFIDSCSMCKYYNIKLHLVDGPTDNIKITTPQDYFVLRSIIESRENAQIYEEE